MNILVTEMGMKDWNLQANEEHGLQKALIKAKQEQDETQIVIFMKCRQCATDEGFDLCTSALCPLYKFELWPGRHENNKPIMMVD